MTRVNSLAGWFIVAIVALSPIPFGSNRPFFWAFSGILVGLASLLFLIAALRSRDDLRVPMERLRVFLLFWGALAAWLVIQALPLGGILGPFAFNLPDGTVLFSNSLSIAPNLTWLMLLRITSYVLLFFMAVQAGANSGRAKAMLTAIFWAIAVHAGFSLFQLTQLGDTILGFPKASYQGFATGTFINRNSFATFLAVGLTIGVSLLPNVVFGPKARNHSPGDAFFTSAVYVAGLVVISIALLATGSRMGLFAGALGVLVVALLALKSSPKPGLFIPVSLLFFVLAGAVTVWVFGQDTLGRVLDLGGSTTGRLDLYQQVMTMIGERPWLGYGGGTFELIFPSFFGPPLNLSVSYDKAHSTYLTLLAELGIPAALLVIVPVVLAFVMILFRQVASAEISPPRLVAIGAIIVTAVHSTVDFSLEIQANAYLLVALGGLAMSTVLNGSRSSR